MAWNIISKTRLFKVNIKIIDFSNYYNGHQYDQNSFKESSFKISIINNGMLDEFDSFDAIAIANVTVENDGIYINQIKTKLLIDWYKLNISGIVTNYARVKDQGLLESFNEIRMAALFK